MSVATMTDRAIAVEGPRPDPVTVTPDVAKAIAAVAAYFPTETIGVYLAVLAIIQPSSSGGRWAFYLIFLVFSGLVVLFYAWKKEHAATGAKVMRKSVYWLLLFSTVSFTIWSATTPWTPFKDITDDAQKYAGAMTIIFAPLLPMAAQVLGITPPWRPAENDAPQTPSVAGS
jgi:hypothetical protein